MEGEADNKPRSNIAAGDTSTLHSSLFTLHLSQNKAHFKQARTLKNLPLDTPSRRVLSLDLLILDILLTG